MDRRLALRPARRRRLVGRLRPVPGELYHHRHVFEAIERPHRILIASTETRLDGSSFDTRLEFTFEARGAGTLMTMVHAGFPDEGLRDEHTRGLPHAFDRLARALGDPGRGSAPARGDRCPAPSSTCPCRSTATSPGPDDDAGRGLGRGGERLHAWLGDGGDGPSGYRPAGPEQRASSTS